MKNKGEYIICSAIHYDDNEKHNHQPRNIDTGFVISGRRHHNCIGTAAIIFKKLGFSQNTDRQLYVDTFLGELETQGFLTNTDKFLNRKEAYIVAEREGRLIETNNRRVLFSENLY